MSFSRITQIKIQIIVVEYKKKTSSDQYGIAYKYRNGNIDRPRQRK